MTALPAEFVGAFNTASDRLGLNDFHPQQRAAIAAFLRGCDVFVSLPTGFGKSAIFQAAPFCCDFLRQSDKCIAIVISPLSALITDQLEKLRSNGIRAAALTKDTSRQTKTAISNGEFSLFFVSPEVLLSSFGRNLLGRETYRQNLCGIFVDESHCVQKWGFGEGKVKAFRSEYGHLAELRSLAASAVPVVALTATATVHTRTQIIKSLGMRNPVIIAEPPRRDNIKLNVVKVRETDICKTFAWKLEELREKKLESERMIIYCRTKKQCNNLYAKFEKELKPAASKERLFAKFHAETDEDIKAYVLTAMRDPTSHIRVLFATVAFGMGIDVMALRTIVHYGAPRDIEEFIQESGRAGRDGGQSHSILVTYPGAGKFTRPCAGMKKFIHCDTCRRKEVLSNFEPDTDIHTIEKHFCCDNCAKQCDCENCPATCFAEMSLRTFEQSGQSTVNSRVVGDELKASLKEQLHRYRWKLLESEGGHQQHFLACGDISSGFPLATAAKIAEECCMIFSFEQFVSQYTFYNAVIEKEVFQIVDSMLKSCPTVPLTQETLSLSDTDTDTSSSISEEFDRPVLFSDSD